LEHWSGSDCSVCPPNWDAEQDCAECANNWIDDGDDCGTCPGNWDAEQDCNACVGNFGEDSSCEECADGWSGESCDTCGFKVDIDSESTEPTGGTWSEAFGSIQQGIDAAYAALLSSPATDDCEVWVAEGYYFIYESGVEDTVELMPGISVYGGFAGEESNLDERDWVAHETMIHGSNYLAGIVGVHHVVTAADDTRLDGFTVTGGQATGEDTDVAGGAVLCSESALILANSVFTGNVAAYNGGAVYAQDCDLHVVGCAFIDNQADIAGAIDVSAGSASLSGCELSENGATLYGGAIRAANAISAITDCLFEGNTANSGGAIWHQLGTMTVDSCVLMGNASSLDSGAIGSLAGDSLSVQNTVLSGNTAVNNGGALYAEELDSLGVVNCTFAQNEAEHGAALYVSQTDGTLNNTVVWGNTTSTADANDIYASWSYFLVDYSLVEGGHVEHRQRSALPEPRSTRLPPTTRLAQHRRGRWHGGPGPRPRG
jgi:predicted outer membrane repeat protein